MDLLTAFMALHPPTKFEKEWVEYAQRSVAVQPGSNLCHFEDSNLELVCPVSRSLERAMPPATAT